MAVTDPAGRELLGLEPGQRATVRPGQAPVVQPFRVNQTALRVTAPPGVLPLLLMPDRARVAGFVAPGVEVNQVFGSRTGEEPGGRRGIEVPAGLPGPYLLVLEGQKDGPDFVVWAVLVEGVAVHQQAMPIRVARGGRLATTIAVTLDPATAGEPRTARGTGGSASPPVSLPGPLPGRILLAPAEVEAAGAR
jgi:hypothetical protein